MTALKRINLPVEGMTCASCVRRVENAIRKLPDVKEVSVNLATESAEVSLVPSAEMTPVVEAIRKAGYDVPASVVDLEIEGMTCASCVRRVEKALNDVPGVSAASVNLASERAHVEGLGTLPAGALIAAVRKAGYQARLVTKAADAGTENRDRHLAALRRDAIVAAILTAPVFVLEMGSHLFMSFHHWLAMTFGQQTIYVISFLLATLVQFGPGLRFYRHGIPALLRLAPDMNSLVAIGSTAAWAYSTVATFFPQLMPAGTANVYFESAAVIVTLVLFGRYLEARAKGQAGDAIRKLLDLSPRTARVARDGTFVDVPVDEVMAGDMLEARPGERIAVDGTVLDGHSHVDEAMISGEPIPVEKREGSVLLAGTINGQGSLRYRATKVGAETLLAQIVRMVEQAQGAKLPIQSLLDRVTAVFVPVVIGVALLTFVAWMLAGPENAFGVALVHAVSVLIIACPCAMGLATPASIMVATGRAAEMGILFRRGEALQTLKDARTVALDKTGTLTKGHPELTDLIPLPGFERDEILRLTASAEARSEHPVAAAIVTAATGQRLALSPATDFHTETGLGIVATVEGHAVLVGADRFMTGRGIDPAALRDEAARAGEAGRTPLYVAIDGRLAALVCVSDPVKETTPDAIRRLHDLGLGVAMLTGDNSRTAQAVAGPLGIDTVVAEVLPGGKVDAIREIAGRAGPVVFVGDGINDAPALAEASVGLAIGTGTDIAIESADVVLMSGDLQGVARAIAVSKATMRNIAQNLFWAFAYNIVLIPVAAGAFSGLTGWTLSPMLAAGAMAMSSVFVLANAMRLKQLK